LRCFDESAYLMNLIAGKRDFVMGMLCSSD